jgi:uncharacterized membrane protein
VIPEFEQPRFCQPPCATNALVPSGIFTYKLAGTGAINPASATKYSDIVKLHESGLISTEQRDRIIERFQIKEEGGKFLAIISFVGAVLIAAGIILLMAANWEGIPHGVKIGLGLLLMWGAHAGGYYLREIQGKYRKSGEVLHLAGSGLFLGKIALIGQIYHLSSRPANAFLLWWAGIAALPWLLRSKAQHVLSLGAFGIWFGMESNQPDSWLYFSRDERQLLLYALLGLLYLGAGYCLRRTSAWIEFAPATEKFGLLLFHLFIYPLTWKFFYSGGARLSPTGVGLFLGLSGTALALIAFGLKGETRLTRQWRWTWGLALLGGIGLMAGALVLSKSWVGDYLDDGGVGFNWIAAIGIFVICLLQIQVGLQMRSAFMVNTGVAFLALNVVTTYIVLIGSMAQTGLVFLISGAFLIAFGIYLERKRRALMQRIKGLSAKGVS